MPKHIKIGIASIHKRGKSPLSNLSMNLIRELTKFLIEKEEETKEESQFTIFNN